MRCGLNKKVIAFNGRKMVCKLCKAEKQVEISIRFSQKEYIMKKNIEDYEKITIFTKYLYPVYTVDLERYNKISEKYNLIPIEEGEFYCIDFINKFKEDILTRATVLEKANYICRYCGRDGETIDHLYPQSKGGADHIVNYVACCRSCNAIKKDIVLNNINDMKKIRSLYYKKKENQRKNLKKRKARRVEIPKENKIEEQINWLDIREETFLQNKKSDNLSDMISKALNRGNHTEKWK